MFCELHSRSAFSFLSSGSQPQRLAARAAELGITKIALLDRDTVAGAVRFHFEAQAQGIKPMVGAEITMQDGSLLPLIPVNLEGYQNLSKLITDIKLENKKGEHSAKLSDIERYSTGLICFTGGADGFMHKSIKNGTGDADIQWLKDVFQDRLYIELQRHYLRHEEHLNQLLLRYAQKYQISYFASNGPHYADKHDRELLDIFTCIKNHCTIYEAGNLLSENSERYLKDHRQMLRLFEDLPEAVEITSEIADRIDFSMDELSYNFPDYPVPNGETMDSLLRQKAFAGAGERFSGASISTRYEVRSRLEKELKIIAGKGLAGYFLQVGDISDFCWQNKILSQGRGSAANSVVCYALGITAVDPIEHDLLFERFLSEKYERYPDIDIDLPSGDDREQVIQHVYRKFGRRSSGMTANVISYRGKSAVREVGKAFGFGTEVLERLSRLNSHYETFKGEELQRRLKEEGFDPTEDRALRKFAEMYQRILDFPRHLGQHSGGMVISIGRLDSIIPLEPASMKDRTIIQWDKDDCEALKIVKVDLLGLGMMAVLRDTIELIRTHHGEDLDLYKIPQNDDKVYEALQKGDTVGMFQVESRAQIAFLPKSKPKNFYDIVVQVAIIRPGPIVGNMLHAYIKRRQGLEKATFPHESLEPILKRTMGVPLFQEQLLKMAMDIAEFSGSEAEELRRAMGFKRPDKKMELITTKLREGMSRKGLPEDAQDQIVEYTKAFANYGFPESHAFSFALLAYASAFFMLHYRACFMAAMFNNYPLGFYSAATLVKDAQRHGLHFIAIDINRSSNIFTVEDSKVRVGLNYIRGLRTDVAERIVKEREENGPYESAQDIISRVPELNKREVRSLSMAGALNFDNTIHRREALWQTEVAIRPQGELFENIKEPTTDHSSAFLQPIKGLGLVETDLRKTGISIGKHPMGFLRDELRSNNILSAAESKELRKGQLASVAGAVIIRQRPMTAKNVVFITLEDETGHSNFVVMPDKFEEYRKVINQSDYLIIQGVFEERGMLKAISFRTLDGFTANVVSHNFR